MMKDETDHGEPQVWHQGL